MPDLFDQPLKLLLLERSPLRYRVRVATLACSIDVMVNQRRDEDRSESVASGAHQHPAEVAPVGAPPLLREHYSNAGGLSSGLQMSVYMIFSSESPRRILSHQEDCTLTPE